MASFLLVYGLALEAQFQQQRRDVTVLTRAKYDVDVLLRDSSDFARIQSSSKRFFDPVAQFWGGTVPAVPLSQLESSSAQQLKSSSSDAHPHPHAHQRRVFTHLADGEFARYRSLLEPSQADADQEYHLSMLAELWKATKEDVLQQHLRDVELEGASL